MQVGFYMGTYHTAGLPANVGYELGTPAYPDPTHDQPHQLPLTSAELAKIIADTQPAAKGGFFWEIFKSTGDGEASATDVARAVCNVVLPGHPRCQGSFPALR